MEYCFIAIIDAGAFSFSFLRAEAHKKMRPYTTIMADEEEIRIRLQWTADLGYEHMEMKLENFGSTLRFSNRTTKHVELPSESIQIRFNLLHSKDTLETYKSSTLHLVTIQLFFYVLYSTTYLYFHKEVNRALFIGGKNRYSAAKFDSHCWCKRNKDAQLWLIHWDVKRLPQIGYCGKRNKQEQRIIPNLGDHGILVGCL